MGSKEQSLLHICSPAANLRFESITTKALAKGLSNEVHAKNYPMNLSQKGSKTDFATKGTKDAKKKTI